MTNTPDTLDFYSDFEDGQPVRSYLDRGPISSTAELEETYFTRLVEAIDVVLKTSEFEGDDA